MPLEIRSNRLSCRGVSWGVDRRVASVAGVLGFAALTALAAQVKVSLLHTPVPMTLQSAAVLLTGVCLGARLAIAAQSVYLLVGLLGLPVFVDGGSGLAYLQGATFGYLVGFPLAAGISARLIRRRTDLWRILAGCLVAAAIVLGCGVLWYGIRFANGDMIVALHKALAPFVFGEFLKVCLASAAGLLLAPVCRRIW